MFGWSAEVGGNRHSDHAERDEDADPNGGRSIELSCIRIQVCALEEAIKCKDRGNRKEHIHWRSKWVSVKRFADVAVNEGSPTCRQAATGTWPVEEKYARTGRQAELLMGAVPALLGAKDCANDGYNGPRGEPSQLAPQSFAWVAIFKQRHREPR